MVTHLFLGPHFYFVRKHESNDKHPHKKNWMPNIEYNIVFSPYSLMLIFLMKKQNNLFDLKSSANALIVRKYGMDFLWYV